MKALPRRKGNPKIQFEIQGLAVASMKALPRRKGNLKSRGRGRRPHGLNESPSQKEGKSPKMTRCNRPRKMASMKALPRRKGNIFA